MTQDYPSRGGGSRNGRGSRRHHDVLDEPDSLRRPLLGSLALHIGIACAVALTAVVGARPVERFGDPAGGGPGSIAITPVSKLPMFGRTGPVNPVANDTESMVPRRPAPEARRPQPDPDAIAIGKKDRNRKDTGSKLDLSAYRRKREQEREGQLYSASGAAASSPLFGAPGSGGVGIGTSNPFGTRFGYYEQLLREKVAQHWKTHEVDPNVRTAPPVIVLFEIYRNGSVRNVRLAQRSGIGALDYSCQRAILEAAPFEPLPAGFERDSALIEFWFQLKR